MNKIVKLLLGFLVCVCSASMITYAKEPDKETLDNIYESVYYKALEEQGEVITDDNSAYAYILYNDVTTIKDNRIYLKDINVSSKEREVLQGFTEKLNVLLELDAIQLDECLKISVKECPTMENRPVPRAAVLEIMPEARRHASEVKKVYDNAVFGTAHITAGLYFSERVKKGGIWDYKGYLGLKNVYYEPELRANMTGETIGNFHYGYVGSAIFGPTVLKAAAGFAQFCDGTTDFSYWNSYFDDPKDQEDIQWGINVYNREH